MADRIEVIEEQSTVVVDEHKTLVTIEETGVEVITVGTQGPQGIPGPSGTPLVTSVAGKQGDVELVPGDLGLEEVNNTSDLDKPVSVATQTALDAKVDKSATANVAYVTDAVGAQTTLNYRSIVSPNSLALRNASSQLLVGAPTANDHATTKAYVDARVPLSGTGFPNGVVTAPVGSIYIDTNATNGAISWIKASGTGNTGWVVENGDTGWRNVPLTDGTGGLFLRRVGNSVYAQIDGTLSGTITNGGTIATIPSGFRLSRNLNGLYGQSGGTPNKLIAFGSSNLVTVWSSPTPSISIRADGTWSTSETWPSTLPGTAV